MSLFDFRQRPVKRRWLYELTHAIIPMYVVAIIIVWVAIMEVTLIIEHIKGWNWLIAVLPCLVNSWALWSALSGIATSVGRKVKQTEIVPLAFDDVGEYLELGAGWRHMKVTFLTVVGKGRLTQTHSNWVEFAIHPETEESVMLDASA